jgi:DNA-binding response OmpR family regulator
MQKKILIIEDEAYLTDLYKMRFEQAGHSVFTADNGEEGLAVAKSEQPDIVLLDIMLPEMDGYEVLKRLRKDAKTKDISVFFLSNMVQDGEIKRGMQAGADDYLIKSNLTPSQLLERLEKFFKGEKSEKSGEKKTVPKKKPSPKIVTTPGYDGNPRILMIEDDDALIEMYMEGFRESGFIVDIARNGAWGVKLALEKEFDIIVLDMVMPAMDGYGTVKKIRENPATKNIPIIILSNSAQEGDIVKAKKIGVSAYLLKSKVTPSQVLEEVKKYLQ